MSGTSLPSTIRSILFDIDGTLVARGKALPGAAESVAWSRSQGLAVRFLTNITSRDPNEIAGELQSQGLAIEGKEIQTATTACVEYLKLRSGLTCHLIVPPSVRHMYDGILTDNQRPDVVVISDIGEQFNFQVLNQAFLMLRGGAELVVPQKGLFWIDHDGPKLDCGSFIVGLEAATGKEAIVTGKPAELFFQRHSPTLAVAPMKPWWSGMTWVPTCSVPRVLAQNPRWWVRGNTRRARNPWARSGRIIFCQLWKSFRSSWASASISFVRTRSERRRLSGLGIGWSELQRLPGIKTLN